MNYHCYNQKFCALCGYSLTCVQSCLVVSVRWSITNSANCGNYRKKSLMAREVIMLSLNRLPSTAFINYTSLWIYDHSTYTLETTHHMPETRHAYKRFCVGLLSCIATICTALSPALLIVKIEIKVRIESGCKCDSRDGIGLSLLETTWVNQLPLETHPEYVGPEPSTATQVKISPYNMPL